MSDLVALALAAIERERPEMADWCENKRHELPAPSKLRALEWICFALDARNQQIAAHALGIDPADLPALGRVLRAL